MYEGLFYSITSFKFRQTDELSKVGPKSPNSFELNFYRDSERRVYWDIQPGPSIFFSLLKEIFSTYLNNIISPMVHLQCPPEGLATESFRIFC